MKFVCDRPSLSEALLNVSRAVEAKSTIPALEGVLLEVQGNTLSLTGYNLEMGMTTKLSVSEAEEGRIVINARIFSDFVRRMAGNEVCFRVDDKYLTTVTSGQTEYTVMSIPAQEYPEIPQVTDGQRLSISQSLLKSMIAQTIFAVAVTDQKPVLMGVLFDIGEDGATLVGVDGYRLAVRKEKIACQEPMKFVVPAKALSELSKMLSDEDEKTVLMYVSQKHILFDIDGYLLITRLLEGDFLDYKTAVPKATATRVKVSVRAMTDCVERVSLIITDKFKSPVRCTFANNTVKLSCVTSIGKVYDEFPCDMQGDPLEIGFNHKYLLDALKNTGCDEVYLSMNGGLSPMTITSEDADSFLFLVLPIRLKND